jgi:hypothetical protein
MTTEHASVSCFGGYKKKLAGSVMSYSSDGVTPMASPEKDMSPEDVAMSPEPPSPPPDGHDVLMISKPHTPHGTPRKGTSPEPSTSGNRNDSRDAAFVLRKMHSTDLFRDEDDLGRDLDFVPEEYKTWVIDNVRKPIRARVAGRR